MANKTNFNAEEWSRVVASPMVAGIAITAAEPSGLWGLLQEGMAGGRALLKAKQDTSTNALVKAVVDDFANGDARTIAQERVKPSSRALKRLISRGAPSMNSDRSLHFWIPKPERIAKPSRAGSRRLLRKLPKQQRRVAFSDLAELQ